MALIKCTECGKDVSSEAKTCPHCGFLIQQPQPLAPDSNKELTNKNQKKQGCLGLVVLFVVIFILVLIFDYDSDNEAAKNFAENYSDKQMNEKCHDGLTDGLMVHDDIEINEIGPRQFEADVDYRVVLNGAHTTCKLNVTVSGFWQFKTVTLQKYTDDY
jgi:uncharacterized membrane protein YvbJ